MVFLRISGKNEQQMEELGKVLLRERLAIDVDLRVNLKRLNYDGKAFSSHQNCLLTAKTKHLLFPAIFERVKEVCGNEMPEVYSVAIVDMDWEEARHLANSVQSA